MGNLYYAALGCLSLPDLRIDTRELNRYQTDTSTDVRTANCLSASWIYDSQFSITSTSARRRTPDRRGPAAACTVVHRGPGLACWGRWWWCRRRGRR